MGLTKIIPWGYSGCIKIVNIIILVTTVCTQSQTGSVQEAIVRIIIVAAQWNV